MKKRKINKKHLLGVLSLLGLGVVVAPVLSSCSGQIEGLNPEAIINSIFPNLTVFIAQIISMVIIFSAILFLVWKPTNKMIERRKQLILNEIEKTTKDREQAALELEEAKQLKIETSSKVQEIIADANKQGQNIIDDATKQAHSDAENILNTANNSIQRDVEKAKASLNEQAINMAFSIAESLMQKKLSEEDDRKAAEAFIKGLENQ